MFHHLKRFALLSFLSLSITTYAAPPITLTYQQLYLPEAIQALAKFLHKNVVVSPTVTGLATLQLQNADPKQAFDALLVTHGLAKWEIGDVWFVASQAELIKRKQEEGKWRKMYDESAELVTVVSQIRYARAGDIADLLQKEQAGLLSKRAQVRIDQRTNTLFVQDVGDHLGLVRALIHKVDVPVQQIMIEAKLVSIDHDFEQELGVQFGVKESSNGRSRKLALVPGKYSVAVAALADGSLLDIKLAALENAGRAELISSPRLYTANQQPAFIESGEEVPYQEVSESGGTAVVFKKAVLGLRVTPQVLPGSKVLLQLQINQDRPSNKMVQGVPTINTRQMMVNILGKSGQTIVLGGIYENNYEEGQQRIPFLNRLPLLGWLFTQQTTRETKRELLIFVTPTIM
ncbi:MAG: secretin N-terminal domain-containing protein [Gammaproteobacteria bacterium]